MAFLKTLLKNGVETSYHRLSKRSSWTLYCVVLYCVGMMGSVEVVSARNIFSILYGGYAVLFVWV